MSVKELVILCLLLIVQYGILFFDIYLPVVIVLLVGIVPVYYLFQKTLKKSSPQEYTVDAYTHDIKILGLGVLCIAAVFLLLFIQESLSIHGGFSVGIGLLIYVFLYIDFLRKKIASQWDYNEVQQGLIKASMALLLLLLCQILYYM